MRRYYRRRSNGLRILAFIVFILLIVYFSLIFETRIRPVIFTVAEAKANSIAIKVINDEVGKTLFQEDAEYSNLVSLKTDGEGRVTALTSNVVEINRLKSKLSVNIQESLSKIEVMKSAVPVGTLLSSGLLSGYGPAVPLRIVPMGYASINITDSFTQAGINQTRHEIQLVVTANMRVLLPLSSTSTQVSTKVPIAQTVIIGTVPGTYTNVDGVKNEDLQDAILNLK